MQLSVSPIPHYIQKDIVISFAKLICQMNLLCSKSSKQALDANDDLPIIVDYCNIQYFKITIQIMAIVVYY